MNLKRKLRKMKKQRDLANKDYVRVVDRSKKNLKAHIDLTKKVAFLSKENREFKRVELYINALTSLYEMGRYIFLDQGRRSFFHIEEPKAYIDSFSMDSIESSRCTNVELNISHFSLMQKNNMIEMMNEPHLDGLSIKPTMRYESLIFKMAKKFVEYNL